MHVICSLASFLCLTARIKLTPSCCLQSELFSKLKRRTLSHSDEDDGLPQSPAPHVTTADLILGGGLKVVLMSEWCAS